MTFVSVLKLRRIIAGYKQHELADELGMSESTFSKIETGRRKPTDEEVTKLAKLLRCKPDLLFDVNDLEIPK